MTVSSIGIVAASFDPLLTYYRDRLGFTLVRLFDARDDHKAAFFDLGNSLLYVVWDADRPAEGFAPVPTRGLQITLEVDDVEAEYRRLGDAGVVALGPPGTNRWGGFGITLCDPQQNEIHLVQVKPTRKGPA